MVSAVPAASLERSAFYAHMMDLYDRYDFLVLPSAQVRAARDTFKAEAATYQAVVLEALGQVGGLGELTVLGQDAAGGKGTLDVGRREGERHVELLEQAADAGNAPVDAVLPERLVHEVRITGHHVGAVDRALAEAELLDEQAEADRADR